MKDLEIAHRGAKHLSDLRSLEKMAQHPHRYTGEFNELPAPTVKGGGDAGLARVIGAGKKGKKQLQKKEEECECSGGDSVCECDDSDVEGGAIQGQLLAEHLVKLHGKGFSHKFADGLMKALF